MARKMVDNRFIAMFEPTIDEAGIFLPNVHQCLSNAQNGFYEEMSVLKQVSSLNQVLRSFTDSMQKV